MRNFRTALLGVLVCILPAPLQAQDDALIVELGKNLFFENTYAISKIAFLSMNTPAYAPHDKPGPGSDTAGIDDAGIKTFSAFYEDWSKADVIYCSGTDPYETKTVLFTEWWMKGRAKIIFALPRRTTGVAWAEKNGGLWLDVNLGTDTILHLAIARLILENGWEDKEFIKTWVASKWDIYSGFGRGTRTTPRREGSRAVTAWRS